MLDTSFRRPLAPWPIEPFEVPHPALPGPLDGLTVLHLSDLHVRRVSTNQRRFRALLDALQARPVDLVALTGDYMEEPGNEPGALHALGDLAAACRARLGVLGIFGNHDTERLRRTARTIDGIHWLADGHADIEVNGARLRVLGSDWPEDLLSAVIAAGDPAEFTLTLGHIPTCMLAAADLGLPLVLAGHTHAGQVRFSPRFAPHTSSDVPMHLASGILRLRSTLCCVSRGFGDGVLEGLRVNCPPQVPLYTLRHGDLPRVERENLQRVTQVVPW